MLKKFLEIVIVLLIAAGMADTATADLTGDWITDGYRARVHITPCAEKSGEFCGTITWLWDNLNPDGSARTDSKNQDRDLRSRPVMGLQILQGVLKSTDTKWTSGTIYDPDEGKTYKVVLELMAADVLSVKGCVLFLCGEDTWRRPDSVPRPAD